MSDLLWQKPGVTVDAGIQAFLAGDDVLLELSQQGKVCHKKCAIFYLAGDCIFPREGIFFLALAGGMALGVAYGIWAASGVALTAILSKFLFKEPFTWLMGLGIVLIVGGVLCIELGAVH